MLCFVGSCVEELQECSVCVSFKMSLIEFDINIHSTFGSKEMMMRYTLGMMTLPIYNHSY